MYKLNLSGTNYSSNLNKYMSFENPNISKLASKTGTEFEIFEILVNLLAFRGSFSSKFSAQRRTRKQEIFDKVVRSTLLFFVGVGGPPGWNRRTHQKFMISSSFSKY